MIQETEIRVTVTPAGGLEFRGGAPGYSRMDIDPQSSLAMARNIVAIHDEIFEREKALREKRTEKTE